MLTTLIKALLPSRAVALVLAVMALAALCAGCWLAGQQSGASRATAAANARHAQALQREQQATQARLAQARADADARALRLQQQLDTGAQYQATLQRSIAHAQLTTRPPASRPAAAQPGSLPTSSQPTSQADPATVATEPPAAVPADRLTTAALSLWDSALAGRPMPIGACDPAQPATPACAAANPLGLDLSHAWANHAANAALCTADRQRHQALVDHLNAMQAAPPAAHQDTAQP